MDKRFGAVCEESFFRRVGRAMSSPSTENMEKAFLISGRLRFGR
jgi:hypothetical protein